MTFPKRFLSCLCLVMFVSTAALSDDFVRPKLIANNNSAEPDETTNKAREEGWILYDFVVDEKGAVTQLIPLLYSNEKYLSKGEDYINNLTYSAAKENGKVVESSRPYLMRFTKMLRGNQNTSIGRGFSTRYNDADNLLLENKIEEANEVMAKLKESYTRNLIEQALYAWLESMRSYKTQDWQTYYDSLYIAWQLKDRLPAKIAMKNFQNLYGWYVYTKQYADAREVILKAWYDDAISIPDSELEKAFADLDAALAQSPQIAQNVTLKANQLWHSRVNRNKLQISTNSGELKAVYLRCLNHAETLTIAPVITVNISDDSHGCRIIVNGTPGTQLTLLEHGAAHTL